MRPFMVSVAWLSVVLPLLGCSAIPEGGDPGLDDRLRGLAASGSPRLGRLVVAPITLALATDEASKGWKPADLALFDRAQIRGLAVRALTASGTWDRVRSSDDGDLDDAWTQHDDYMATIAIQNLRTHFDGRNGWWIPNMVNFVLNTPFAWFVATEEYSLTLEVVLTVTSVDSGATVLVRTIPVRISGSFDEFDRGWQVLGPIVSSLDAEGWRGIAARLFPAARTELAVATAYTLETALRTGDGPVTRVLQRKTLVLAVGLSRYEDPRALPPLPYPKSDAEAVADAFRRLGAMRQHVMTLVDEHATIASVCSAISEHLGRARDDDTVVFYFAGYGIRQQDGKARLVLHDARIAEGTASLALDELARLLGQLNGKKLVVVDAGFAGSGRRSVSGSIPATREDSEALEGTGITFILAGGANDPVLSADHLESGLLTYHFVRELNQLALGPGSQRLGIDALKAVLQERVSADAEYLGVHQVPTFIGLGNRLEIARSDHPEERSREP